MFDALRAEALKMRRHRATWLMVWIYPVATLVLLIGTLIYAAVSGSQPSDPQPTAAAWVADSTLFWDITGSGPGRVLIAGFAAMVFAGEYGWNTWKLIIPARSRWQLVAAKWAIAIGFVLLAFIATDLIVLVGEWLRTFQGSGIPDGVTIGALAPAHLRAATYAVLPIGYTVAFAGLFAVLTRSILATVILSIVLVFAEALMTPLGILAYRHAPGVTRFLVEVLPPYHMANMITWARDGAGLVIPLGPDAMVSLSWATSFWALMAWIAAAAAATMLHFLRQDQN